MLAPETILRGEWSGTVEDLARRVPQDAVYEEATVAVLARLYRHWSGRYGLRTDALWAQMLLETDGLRFPGQVESWQFNFAGIKTAEGDGFASFPTLERGVIGHVVHVAWYCYRDHVRPECTDLFDPRHAVVDGRPHYGRARTIADLAGTWAEGLDYDQKICRVWNLGV